MNTRTTTALALLTLSLARPAIAADPGALSPADEAAIRQTLARYAQALNQGDAAAAAALYTADGVRMAPDIPSAVGRPALQASHAGTFAAVALDLRFTVDEITALGPATAVLRSRSDGTVQLRGEGQSPRRAAFKELFVLRHEADGGWRFSHYAFAPAPLPQP